MPRSAPAKPHESKYPTLSPDTDPEAEAVQLEIYRRMPAGRKIQLVFEAIEMNRDLVMASPEEVRLSLFDLTLGPELAERAYGPLPDST